MYMYCILYLYSRQQTKILHLHLCMALRRDPDHHAISANGSTYTGRIGLIYLHALNFFLGESICFFLFRAFLF